MYREKLSRQQEFVCLALRSDLTFDERRKLRQLFSEIGATECFEFSERNKVAATVATTLDLGIGATKAERGWLDYREANLARVTLILETLQEVAKQLLSASIPCAVIENGGVLLGTKMPPDAFAAGDVDLLVSNSHWIQAIEVLKKSGLKQQARKASATTRVEFLAVGSGETSIWINVCASPFDRTLMPLRFNDRSEVWLSRRVEVEGFSGIFVLDPADSLALVCVHTSLHSFVRSPFVRLHADADWLARRCAIEWSPFVEEVFCLGLPTRVWLALEMARFLLGSPIPDDVTARLAPRRRIQNSLIRLIANEGSFATDHRKLAGWKAIRLEGLLSDDRFGTWLGDALWPEAAWLRERFGGDASNRRGRIGLNMARLQRGLKQWRSE